MRWSGTRSWKRSPSLSRSAAVNSRAFQKLLLSFSEVEAAARGLAREPSMPTGLEKLLKVVLVAVYYCYNSFLFIYLFIYLFICLFIFIIVIITIIYIIICVRELFIYVFIPLGLVPGRSCPDGARGCYTGPGVGEDRDSIGDLRLLEGEIGHGRPPTQSKVYSKRFDLQASSGDYST